MRKLKLKVHDRAFNKQFFRAWQDKSDLIVSKGSAGSGKSEIFAQKTLLRLMLEPGHRALGLRKVAKTIRNSVWLLLNDQIRRYNLEKLFYKHNTDMYLRCKANGNELITVGLDDKEKLKSIVQPTFGWMEETTEFTEDDLDQVITRFRGWTPHYKQIMCGFNPIDEYHWIRKRYFPDEIEQLVLKQGWAKTTDEIEVNKKIVKLDTLLLHSTHWDNKFLMDEDHARYERFKETNPQHYEVYGLGHWGRTEGLVYHQGYTMIEKVDYPNDYEEIIYGLDFGYTHPTSFSRYYLRHKDGFLESYTEELIFEKGLEIKDLIEKMKECNVHPNDVIYADYQATEKIDQLQNYQENGQYLFNVVLADKSIEDGIDYVRTVKRFSCPENINHNKEIKTYRFALDTKRTSMAGKPVYDDKTPVKFQDDCMDNERYALFTHGKSIEVKLAFI